MADGWESPKVLDIFAGAGGFSLGFSQAGFKIVGAVEMDKWASETFSINHASTRVIQKDIKQLSDQEVLSEFDNAGINVLLGGPPCQGFSHANIRNSDRRDPRNALFVEFLRFAKLLKPRVVVMENVPTLLGNKTNDGRFVIEIIQSELESLGYHVTYRVLHAIHFGVPQIRKRLFVLATEYPFENLFPSPTHYWDNYEQGNLFADLKPTPTLWDAISDLPQLASGEGIEEMDYETPPNTAFQTCRREGADKLYNHKAMRHSPKMVQRFSEMKWGDSVSDVSGENAPLQRSTPGTISTKRYDQNNRRMYPDRPCHTVPASFYANFVHPFCDRNFTAREGARIQSFPDTFQFKGKPTVVSHKLLTRENRLDERHLCQYNQIGNAVPPLVGKALATAIKEAAFS